MRAKGQITHTHTRRALPHVDVTQWPCCHTQCPSATERHRGRGQGWGYLEGGGGLIWGKCSGRIGEVAMEKVGRERRKERMCLHGKFLVHFCTDVQRSFSSFRSTPPSPLHLTHLLYSFSMPLLLTNHNATLTAGTECTPVAWSWSNQNVTP